VIFSRVKDAVAKARSDIMPTTTVIVAGNGGREVSVMFSHVKDAVAKAHDRAQVGIS
jgi:hypothetical protein